MGTVRFSNKQIGRRKGRVNWAKLRATTEEDIKRYQREDGYDESVLDAGYVVVTPSYVRRIRERLGLTQPEFAKRFWLSQRTVQEWEQGRSMPEGPARVLLRVIEREPAAVARALKVS